MEGSCEAVEGGKVKGEGGGKLEEDWATEGGREEGGAIEEKRELVGESGRMKGAGVDLFSRWREAGGGRRGGEICRRVAAVVGATAPDAFPPVSDGFLHLEREFEVGIDGLDLGDPGGDCRFARHACSYRYM